MGHRIGRGIPPALVKGSRAPSMRSHGTCTMFLGYPCTPCTLHCRHANPHPFMVRSLQLVEVRPYAEEEEVIASEASMAVLVACNEYRCKNVE